jgi:DNA-binding protein YbaB
VPDDIGAAERMVRDWQERAAEKAEKFGRMQSAIESITVSETSRDGAVRVTVGSSGILQDLQLADSAGKMPMPRLAAEIMRAVQAAQAKIPELMQQAAADTVGVEDPAVQHVLGQARKHFPEPPEEEEEPRRASGLQEMQFGVEDDAPPQRPTTPQHPTPPQHPTTQQRPPAPPQPPQPPRPQRRQPDDFDDDDFSSGSFLR